MSGDPLVTCVRCARGAHSECDATARDAQGALTLCGCGVCLEQFEQGRNPVSGDPLDLDAIEEDARHTGARPSVAQTLSLVAEVRRLRTLEAELRGVRGIVAAEVERDAQGGQWAGGYRAASRMILRELDGALGVKAARDASHAECVEFRARIGRVEGVLADEYGLSLDAVRAAMLDRQVSPASTEPPSKEWT